MRHLKNLTVVVLIIFLSLPISASEADWRSFQVGVWYFEKQTQIAHITMTIKSTQTYGPDRSWHSFTEQVGNTQGFQMRTGAAESHGTWKVRGLHGNTFILTVRVNGQDSVEKLRRLGPNSVRNESHGFVARRIDR